MDTRTVVITDPVSDAALIAEAGAALADGRLLVFPTETVYGLGASAVHAEAIDALSRLKDRGPGKPFTLHLADPAEAETYAGPLPAPAARLVRKVWPGPLTLVVPDRRPTRDAPANLVEEAVYQDGTVGLRCPDHAVATAILRSAGVPVVATSANVRGHPPPRTAADALADLRGRVPLVVDAGPARFAEASTVVRVHADGRHEVLREGYVTAHRIDRLVRTSIVFICTGNLCRSPMAAGLARHLLAERLGCRVQDLTDRGIDVTSAGTGAVRGSGASAHAVQAMAERGIDIRGHRSQPMTVDALRAADYIWVMTRGHQRETERLAPEAADRVALVDPSGDDVADPIGGSLDTYRACARRLEEALAERLREVM